MVKPQKLGKNVRMSFAKINEALEMPNLIEVQKKSFQWFLNEGLQEVLRDVSPIVDYSGNLSIEFVSYTLDFMNPRYPVEECKDRDVTYDAPLRVEVRLTNKQTGEVKQSEIFMGNFPLMTENGTFVINGAERVIVSQLVRSPGIYYDSTVDKTGKRSYTATVIPYRGAWLEYETDSQDVFYVKIDKTRKIPITVLIRALGEETDEDIRRLFGEEEILAATFGKDECAALAAENKTTLGEEALKEVYKKLRPGEPPLVESAQILINNLFFDPKRYDLANVGRYKYDKKLAIANRIVGHRLASDVISPLTGEVIAETGALLDRELATAIEQAAVNVVDVLTEGGATVRVFGNGTVDPAWVLGYDLKDCGVSERVRFGVLREIIDRVNEENPLASAEDIKEAIKREARAEADKLSPKHITKDDIFASINYLLNLTHGVGSFDDIDHLGNRRLRCVGELLQNQMRIGFARMDKNINKAQHRQDLRKISSNFGRLNIYARDHRPGPVAAAGIVDDFQNTLQFRYIVAGVANHHHCRTAAFGDSAAHHQKGS